MLKDFIPHEIRKVITNLNQTQTDIRNAQNTASSQLDADMNEWEAERASGGRAC